MATSASLLLLVLTFASVGALRLESAMFSFTIVLIITGKHRVGADSNCGNSRIQDPLCSNCVGGCVSSLQYGCAGGGCGICCLCIAGYYCLDSGPNGVTGPCPVGSYCPLGTGVNVPACPAVRNLDRSRGPLRAFSHTATPSPCLDRVHFLLFRVQSPSESAVDSRVPLATFA